MTAAHPIAANLARIRERIAAAVARRGPGPEVILIGVSKRHPIAAIEAAMAAGLADFGENYAQELRDKIAAIGHDPPRWHFIGGLQRNKVKYAVGKALIHTVDRAEIVDAIEARAAREEVTQDVLVEVNLGDEAQKAGIAEAELPALLDRFAATPHVRCRGLMIIPPVGPTEVTRPYFASLRELRDRLAATPREGVTLEHLSMGMSDDFEAAIEEGATLVRVGTAIFGPRPS
ncbi:MAG: YggS family pyridoxal phosphate-dependent enzyme [Myxococcales bacterium]|nr:YggS family pyridoxal phosphate-dependent enzyme [Myxococcales bacterium]